MTTTKTIRQSKSWVELSYNTDSEEENDDDQILNKKSQSEQLPETSQLSQSTHSIESSDQLPRYYVRLLKMVEQSNASVFEVVIRGCPTIIRKETIQSALPFVECKITQDLVIVFLKKRDLIELIHLKQLTIKLNNEDYSLIVQRHSEEVAVIEKKLEEQEKSKNTVLETEKTNQQKKTQNRNKQNLNNDLSEYIYRQKGKKFINSNNHYRYKRDE